MTEAALLDHAERALAAWLLVETDDGAGVQFTHALVRETLYGMPGALRRPGWHRKVAEALSRVTPLDTDAVAHHFRQANDPRAVVWLVRAGERAERIYAWHTAGARFAAAVAVLSDDVGPAERGWLLYRSGFVAAGPIPRKASCHWQTRLLVPHAR